MLAAGLALGEHHAVRFSVRSAAALVYLILAGSVAGFLAYAYALRHLPVSTVSLYAYFNPIIAVVLGALILREPLSARIAGAAALVLTGVAIVRLPSRGKGNAPANTPPRAGASSTRARPA